MKNKQKLYYKLIFLNFRISEFNTANINDRFIMDHNSWYNTLINIFKQKEIYLFMIQIFDFPSIFQ